MMLHVALPSANELAALTSRTKKMCSFSLCATPWDRGLNVYREMMACIMSVVQTGLSPLATSILPLGLFLRPNPDPSFRSTLWTHFRHQTNDNAQSRYQSSEAESGASFWTQFWYRRNQECHGAQFRSMVNKFGSATWTLGEAERFPTSVQIPCLVVPPLISCKPLAGAKAQKQLCIVVSPPHTTTQRTHPPPLCRHTDRRAHTEALCMHCSYSYVI